MELTPAEKHYESLKKAQREYYARHKEAILTKNAEAYRKKHPEICKRGRPRKVHNTPPTEPEVVAIVNMV